MKMPPRGSASGPFSTRHAMTCRAPATALPLTSTRCWAFRPTMPPVDLAVDPDLAVVVDVRRRTTRVRPPAGRRQKRSLPALVAHPRGQRGSLAARPQVQLVLNVPLVSVFVTVLRLPQHVLATLVLLLCLVGAFSLSNSILDLWVLVIFGVFGYALRKLRVDPSAMVVALVLGPMMEKTLRQALFLMRGSVVDLVARPLSATILLLAAAALFGPSLVRLLRGRRVAKPLSETASKARAEGGLD
jgi:hypothetical protein